MAAPSVAAAAQPTPSQLVEAQATPAEGTLEPRRGLQRNLLLLRLQAGVGWQHLPEELLLLHAVQSRCRLLLLRVALSGGGLGQETVCSSCVVEVLQNRARGSETLVVQCRLYDATARLGPGRNHWLKAS